MCLLCYSVIHTHWTIVNITHNMEFLRRSYRNKINCNGSVANDQTMEVEMLSILFPFFLYNQNRKLKKIKRWSNGYLSENSGTKERLNSVEFLECSEFWDVFGTFSCFVFFYIFFGKGWYFCM